MNIKTTRPTVLSATSLLVGLTSVATAQDLSLETSATDAMPRTVFASEPLDTGPLWYCHPTNCKRKQNSPDFPNWTHTTNTGKPPRTIWIVSCLEDTYHGWRYDHRSLAPGKTQWSTIQVPLGHWSWITNWVIDPWGWLGDTHETANSFSGMDASGAIVPETFGTVQVQPMSGLEPVTSSCSIMPTDETPWHVDRTYTATPTGMVVSEDWSSSTDQLVNQYVDMTIVRDPAGYIQTMEVDRGKDGTIDHISHVDYVQHPSGDLSLVLQAFDGTGQLDSAFYATKTFTGAGSVMTTLYDNDGDGVDDLIITETTTVAGQIRTIVLESDEGADGSIDTIETNVVEFRGERDSSQLTTITDGAGVTLEVVSIELTPTPSGYLLDTFHDSDGDNIFDVRETQLSSVGPFANGVDDDYLGIDNDMDGVYDVISRTAAIKSLQGSVYSELVATDVRNDGVIDGVMRRIDTVN